MNNIGSPAQIKNYQSLFSETQKELKDLTNKVNSAKSKGINTPEYRFVLNQYYNKQLESLDFLDKLNNLQGKKVDLSGKINQVKKRLEFLKKAQNQAKSLTTKNVENQTQKNIEAAKNQQQINVDKAQSEMKKKMEDYQMALRKWHQGDKKNPPPTPPTPSKLPNVQIQTQQLPANFIKPQKLSEIRNIVREILNEGKNPFQVMDYYLKSEPALIQKLKANDNALLKRLAYLDFEFNPEKMEVGKIFPWLLNLWKKGDQYLNDLLKSDPKSEIVTKFKNAQELFNKSAFRKSIKITDIQKFKNIDDFMNVINKAFFEKNEIPSMASFGIDEINKDIKEGIIMKTNLTNNNYLVVSPLKKKGACKYGNTHMEVGAGRWCTANEENNAFDSYKDGILYIFMDKNDNLKSKYQFYYKEKNFQFNDENNRSFDHRKFFDQNTDVFEKLFPNIVNSLKEKKDIEIDNQVLAYFPTKYFEYFKKNILKFAGPVIKLMAGIISGEITDPQEAFTDENIGIGDALNGFDADDKGITLNMDLDNYDNNLNNYVYASKHGYDSYEFQYEELDYIQNYVLKEDIPLFISLIQIFKPDFKDSEFEEEGAVNSIINEQPANKYFSKLVDNFSYNYSYAINESQQKWIDSTLAELPITLYYDGIYIEYKKLINYCVNKNIVKAKSLNEILEQVFENSGINEDNYYDYYNNDIDYKEVSKQLSKDLHDISETLEDDDEIGKMLQNKKDIEKTLKDLGFNKYYGIDMYSLNKPDFSIETKKFDLENNKVYISYKHNKNKEFYNGWVNVEDLHKYATMEMMFEGIDDLRKLIRTILNKKPLK